MTELLESERTETVCFDKMEDCYHHFISLATGNRAYGRMFARVALANRLAVINQEYTEVKQSFPHLSSLTMKSIDEVESVELESVSSLSSLSSQLPEKAPPTSDSMESIKVESIEDMDY